MKIKRFEAPNMSEALRKIKKEFGEEAVILSAKTVKKNGLLGISKGSQVVVTAAIDKAPVAETAKEIDIIVNPASDEGLTTGASKAGANMNILKHFKPITPTGQKKVKPKIVQLMSASEDKPTQNDLLDRLVSKGISKKIAAELENKVSELLPRQNVASQDYLTALAQVFDAEEMISSAGIMNRSKQRVLVMLGPSGVGKTSAAAKLCAKHTIQLQESVALISFDNQRVAGTAELERYARILDVPLYTISDMDELNAAIKAVEDADLVIVDTPGLNPEDQTTCEKIQGLLSALDEPERYLLINADAQESVMARIIDFFRPLEVQRLFLTRLDWAADIGPVINRIMNSKLPVAYLSDSSKVPEGLQVATAQDLARRIILPDNDQPALPDDPGVTVIQSKDRDRRGAHYVANRNSDIFHLHSCKSVKRINTDNMIVFKDPAEAIGRQFKPCRMCCSELIFPKPIDRLARGYAGHRYYHQ